MALNIYCFEAERHSTTSIVCCGRGVSGACASKGAFTLAVKFKTGHGLCKIGDVKAVIRTPERTRVLNPRLPEGGALSPVALELGECESNSKQSNLVLNIRDYCGDGLPWIRARVSAI